jgi:threonine aldolase
LCFGATKNGAMAAEAIVAFDPETAETIAFRRKRAGHLICKNRFIAAQLLAYLDDDLWLDNADRANAAAERIGEAAGEWLANPVEANQVFLKAAPEAIQTLRAHGVEFYDWGPAGAGEARLVVSYNQTDQDVADLCSLLRALRATV